MRKLIGLVIVVLIMGIIVYNLVGNILSALKSGDRLTAVIDKLNQAEMRNKELKKQLEKVTSPEFIEQQARNKLGLAKEGETIIVIPEEKINEVLGTKQENNKPDIKLPNWLGWVRLFLP